MMASFHATLLCKEYTSYCCCARVGRSKYCVCGEDDRDFCWTWDPYSTHTDSSVQEDGREVLFHTNYSRGTAAIRGTEPFREGHHFWEVKMTTPVYGTDMMIGVATEEMELDKYRNSFCSLLGRDRQSWGLSYLGSVHHMGTSQPFSEKIGQGAIVGVHLDMWHGTLAYYLNRKPLGVAYHGLRGKVLYPVVSSTAARSGMKVISTRSFPSNLQFLCCMTLRRLVHKNKCVLDVVTLPPGLRIFLQNNLGWLLRSQPSTPLLPPKYPSFSSVDRATQAHEDDFKSSTDCTIKDNAKRTEEKGERTKQKKSAEDSGDSKKEHTKQKLVVDSGDSEHEDDKEKPSTSRGGECSGLGKSFKKMQPQTLMTMKRRRSWREMVASQADSSSSTTSGTGKKSKIKVRLSMASQDDQEHRDLRNRMAGTVVVICSGQTDCSDADSSEPCGHSEQCGQQPSSSCATAHAERTCGEDLELPGAGTSQRIPFPRDEELPEMNTGSSDVDGMFKAFSEFLESQSDCSSEGDYAASTETEESSDQWSPCKKRRLI